jgi:DNA-binding PadR family transcriptional regulator
MAKEAQTRPYEVMFYMAIRDGPAYGYQLAARFRKMSGGHIKVSYGTIYPFLRRMERRGVIRSSKDEKSGRIYYELTRRGMETEKRVSKRMKECQKDMEKLLGILCMHSQIFGRKALRDLLRHANNLGSPRHGQTVSITPQNDRTLGEDYGRNQDLRSAKLRSFSRRKEHQTQKGIMKVKA